MHRIVKAHFEADAESHEKRAARHSVFHSLNKAHAQTLEDAGDPVTAAHFRAVATEHAQAVKAANADAQRCRDCAKSLEAFGVGESASKVIESADLRLQKIMGSNEAIPE